VPVPTVQVVLCMDTEGPCRDPANPELLGSWPEVEAAMNRLFLDGFRERYPDPAGGCLRIGWFFLTWTGFRENPRDRALGHHAVRDRYVETWGRRLTALGDEECWHYHHPHESGVANEWGLDWGASREYETILSRQLLERDWFPSCYRAGGTIMDPVSSRWVDCWFPIDYSNRAPLSVDGLVDWSTGVADWGLYHPDPEDFRRPGAGRRRMARCLDLQTGVHLLAADDVGAAFERARAGLPAILSVFEHDYRDIEGRLDRFRALVHEVAAEYPDVPWRYAAPVEAVRAYVDAPTRPPLELDAADTGRAVHVRASAPLYQAIPWLAVRLADGDVRHVEEGLLREDETHWSWTPPAGLDWEEAAFGGSTDLAASATVTLRRGEGPGAVFLRRLPVARSVTAPRSIWHHSTYFQELCIARASGEAAELDSVHQAVELLAPRLAPGDSVLDVGCASGHAWRSFRALGVDYHGVDPRPRAIEIGRQLLAEADLPPSHLRTLELEQLPVDERYDAVVCLNWLSYFPMFHQPLEIMARAARRWLVVRASFGERTEIRYVPDAWLEPGFQTMRTYLNIWSRSEVQAFLEGEGFAVSWEEDERQRDRFGGEPEVVAGIPIPYDFVCAERVREPPTPDEILGAALGEVARSWTAARTTDAVGAR
jgi:SAM-dependent methyltransferase